MPVLNVVVKACNFRRRQWQGLFLAVMLGRMWTGDGGVRWGGGAARCPRVPIGSSEPSPAISPWETRSWKVVWLWGDLVRRLTED